MHLHRSVFFLLIDILFISNICHTQVIREWVARYNGQNSSSSFANSVAVDDTGNVFVTGGSSNSSSSSLTTIKYNSSGIQQWIAKYYGIASGPNESNSIKLDKNGNVYIAGSACVTYPTQTDLVILKYSSAGAQQWVASYHSELNGLCWGNSLVLDDSSNVYAAGTRTDSIGGADFVTVKYSPSGVQQWVRRYNGPSNYQDYASKIIIDNENNLYVSGVSWITEQLFEYAAVKYNSNGVQQWVIRQFGSDNTSEYRHGLVVDRSGNVYFAASSGYAAVQNYFTAKYNSAGSIQWMSTYTAPGLPSQSEASSVAIDTLGNVYVTGYSFCPVNLSLQGCVTIKYNSSGVQQWLRVYGGTQHFAGGIKILTDAGGNVYVMGYVENVPGDYDYLTLSYDNSGLQRWVDVYNGTGNNTDISTAMVLDRLKNVYVTGWSSGISSIDIVTIKYSQPIGIHPISSLLPKEFHLFQNYPNPFNPSTKIKFEIPLNKGGGFSRGMSGVVTLKIFDILGREITTLENEQLKPGTYEVEFDGTNYPSGVYFYKLTTESFDQTKRMVLLK
jgi:hypothetical protein